MRAGHETRITNHGLYTSITASQRNEVMAVLSRDSAVRWGEMQAGLPRPRRVRAVENSRTGCPGAAGGRASPQVQGGHVFLANQVSEWPFGSPWVRKSRTTRNRRPVTASLPAISRLLFTACLLTIARHCAAKNIAPEQVSAHRQPFSVGLTTSAVRCSSRRPPGSFRCCERKMTPC